MKECNRIRDLFGSYISNITTPDERVAVEDHLEICKECASELRSLQGILGTVKTEPVFDEMLQKTQGDFASNVYRRIASDALRRRSQQVFLRRFVMQPSIAAVVLAVIMAIGFSRIYTGKEPSPGEIMADKAGMKERRASLYVEEFFRRQGALRETGTESTELEEVLVIESPSSNIDHFMQDRFLPDSQRLLENANFINYSLKDPRRALSEYQRLIDYYPGTEEAIEAREKARAILEVEHNIRIDKVDIMQISDPGI